MKTSVVIPTINRKATALRLLQNLADQSHKPDEIILIEGGPVQWSVEELPEILKTRTKLTYVTRPSAAASRDGGRKQSSGDVIFFFDDDIILPPNYIQDSLTYLNNNPTIMAVGGLYSDKSITERTQRSIQIGRLFGIYADGSRNRILPSGWADYVRGPFTEETTAAEWLFGCNLAVRMNAFENPTVSFETRMQAWSFLDDVLLGARLTRAYGDCMRLLPNLRVIHAPPSTSGSMSKTTLRMRILYRYILWRDYIADGSASSLSQFLLGMLANLLLMLKQEPKLWVIRETLKTHFFNLRHRDMSWETANEFIFSSH